MIQAVKCTLLVKVPPFRTPYVSAVTPNAVETLT